jgi:glycosyltransferase involved in cell wall biosynthesis
MKKRQPLVSVIIPYYNGSKYIEQCLDSVFAQTYKNYEIILVDDCSTENSKEVLAKYLPKIRYYRMTENHGRPAPVKNFAISKSKGELIAFLDQDDWWEPTKLEKQVPLFKEENVGLVFSNASIYEEKSGKKIGNFFTSISLSSAAEAVSRRLFLENFIIACTVVIRKEVFKIVGGFDENYKTADDYDLSYRISKISELRVVNESLATWRLRSSSISISGIEPVILDHLYFYEKFKENKEIPETERNQIMSNYLRKLAIYQSVNGEFGNARKTIKKAAELQGKKTKLFWLILLLPQIVRFIPKCRNLFVFKNSPKDIRV